MNKTANRNAPAGRLESLDALRGFDMFFIMGGASLIAVIASFFPDSGFWNAMESNMGHVPWDGLKHHDTIFPLFLFIAGISFPFSLAKQRSGGKSEGSIYWKIVRRGLVLFLLGLIYNGLLDCDFAHARIPSVLGRIGLAWMFAALIYTGVHPRSGSSKDRKISPVAICAGVVVVLLVGYALLTVLVHAPDNPSASVFSKEGNIACYVDRVLLKGHILSPLYDPEGILSTIPAIGTAMLGMLTGAFVRREDISGSRKALWISVAGVAFAILGWAWNFILPINKALWSSSFVCAVAGYSLLVFALFYYIIDVKGWRTWAFFFVVIGLNSITIYLAQRFIPFGIISESLFGGIASFLSPGAARVFMEVAYIALCWLFLYFLYRKKTFLKV